MRQSVDRQFTVSSLHGNPQYGVVRIPPQEFGDQHHDSI